MFFLLPAGGLDTFPKMGSFFYK